MFLRRLLQAALCSATLIVGCYEPQLTDCTVLCSGAGDCADGQVCGMDGFCASPERAGSCAQNGTIGGVTIDGGATTGSGTTTGGGTTNDGGVSGGQPDAPLSACQAACPGTCDGGTCVINCTATGSCQSDVICPPGLPCRIACGDGACKRVRCDLATSCDITCSGKNSCAERITCGPGRCDVACSGDHACRRGVDCHASCACDVTCIGTMTCRDESTCPMNACDDGHGCSADGSCDRCM